MLRPFTSDDLDDLYAIQSRADVARYLYWNPRTREEVTEVLEQKKSQTQLATEDDALVLAVALPGTSETRVIGEVVLWLRSMEHRQGEIGFVMHPDYQGNGFATEAASAVLDLAFGEFRLHRVYGRTDGGNRASGALMRRLGMRQEAHLVQNEIFKGEWSDELVFAMLEDEWPARREALRGGA